MRLKLFLWALTHIPGNRTVGFNDRLPGERKWLPLEVVLQFDGSKYIIDNFRALLPYVYREERTKELFGRAPHVRLQTTLPKNFSHNPGAYIAINPFSNSSHRSWPLWRWKELLTRISQEFPQYPLLILGGPKEVQWVEELSQTVPGSTALQSLPLLEAAGVIDAAALYIGVDTGPTHIACVLQQKSLIISHFRFPTWRPTYNPHARVIANSRRCECMRGGKCVVVEDGKEYSYCMYDISDDFVLSSVRLALSSPERSIPSFAGFIDENGAHNVGKNNSADMRDEVTPQASY